MGARENECQISQNYVLHMKFWEFYLCNHNSCEIWHSISRISMRNFLWCYYIWFITSLALPKCKKRMQYSLNYSGTRFLFTENENCSISWWIISWMFSVFLGLSGKISVQSFSYHLIRKISVMKLFYLWFALTEPFWETCIWCRVKQFWRKLNYQLSKPQTSGLY